MTSCLYECSVSHKRLLPKQHAFNYRIFMFCLDLDEIDAIARRIPFFSRNRWNLYSFNDHDHLDLGRPTVKENLIAFLHQREFPAEKVARVLLITLPRVLGYIFNPVSFYFCFDSAGTPLCAVAQVGNTFREMKPFLLRDQENGVFHLRTPKHFYVSPFSELDLEFDFKLHLPGERMLMRIDDLKADGTLVLTSALGGRRQPLTAARLLWLTLKFPLITLKVIFFIHYHAALLWLRRVPWFAKSANPGQQRGVLHPHSSISGKTS